MNSKKIGFLLLGLVIFFSISLNIWTLQNQERIVYVDLLKVFNDFEGKKSIEAKFTSIGNKRKQVLDSMALDLQVLQNKINTSPKAEELSKKLHQKTALYTRLSNDFAAQNQEEDQKFSDKIWTQINQYTNDFGERNGYDFIYGVSGNGALMYGKPNKNITEDLIKYINSRYEGL